MTDTEVRYLSAQVSNEFYWKLKQKIVEHQETMQEAIIKSLCTRFDLEYPQKGGLVDEPDKSNKKSIPPKRHTRSHETVPGGRE